MVVWYHHHHTVPCERSGMVIILCKDAMHAPSTTGTATNENNNNNEGCYFPNKERDIRKQVGRICVAHVQSAAKVRHILDAHHRISTNESSRIPCSSCLTTTLRTTTISCHTIPLATQPKHITQVTAVPHHEVLHSCLARCLCFGLHGPNDALSPRHGLV